MIDGAGRQNKTLRDAASRPKDTSHRLDKATRYSAKVSASKSTSTSEERTTSMTANPEASQKIKGSFAGFINTTSAYLQPNGVGYDNKKHQAARYRDKSVYHPGRLADGISSLNKNDNYSIMNNYSSQTMKDSSSHRLNNIVETNMMFK